MAEGFSFSILLHMLQNAQALVMADGLIRTLGTVMSTLILIVSTAHQR